MKRILSLMLSLILAAGVFAGLCLVPTYALTEELLVNPGFEDDMEGWSQYGDSCNLEIVSDSTIAHSGDNCLLVSERPEQYATCWQPLKDVLLQNGPGKYRLSVAVKVENAEDAGAKALLVLNWKQNGKTTYVTEKITLKTDWQVVTFENADKMNFSLDDPIESSGIYIQVVEESSLGGYVGFYADDFSLKKVSEVNGKPVEKLPEVEMTHLTVSKELISAKASATGTATVGAIRWDAWTTHDGVASSVVSQVEKSLSPSYYHFRAPFFAEVTADGKITIPSYTQKEFDQEMLYAKDAGIDYFAYVFYTSNMRAARDFHMTSQYRKDVKMCSIFDGNAIKNAVVRKEMKELLTQDYWMTVLDGRPLMYYFASNNNDAITEDIEYYRALCQSLSLPMPYVVIMNNANANTVFKAYGDAMSRYGFGGDVNGSAFAKLAADTEKLWQDWKQSALATDTGVVPMINFGWHNKTRFENPVSWTKASENSWVQYATAAELTDHTKKALSFVDNPGNVALTVANTAIIYAWNEHDEGGWICPTIAVDEQGNQLYNEDGTKKINTEHLDALKAAITDYRAGNVAETPTEAPADNATNAPSATAVTATPGKAGKSNTLLFVIIGATAVIVAGAVVAIVLIRKKQSATETDSGEDTDNTES